MQLLGKDEVLFELLKIARVRILDSIVKRINIFIQDADELCIEIDFDHPQYKGSFLKLRFLGIKEYSFYHNDSYTFSCVECFKLIKTSEFFYLSLDPEDEFSTVISDADQDLIVYKSFEGYYVES